MLALVGVWGCSPDPDIVYVDLSAAELRRAETAAPAPAFDLDSYSLSKSVPSLESTDVFFGSAEERATEALEVYRQAQQVAAKTVLERLKKAYTVEVDQAVGAERQALRQQYAERLDDAIEDLYELFVQHAEELEPVRFELTQIVGFPDPDPRSLKVPLESNVRAYQNFLKARSLREQIIALDTAYKAEAERRFSQIESVRQSQLQELAQKEQALKSEALVRAQEEADKVTKDAQAVLERTALDPEARLPAVPGAASSVNSGSATSKPSQSAQAMTETREDVEAQLKVFLKTYGYRRTRDAALGRNATQEFLEWRRKYTDGR